jgi:hypothetical protein
MLCIDSGCRPHGCGSCADTIATTESRGGGRQPLGSLVRHGNDRLQAGDDRRLLPVVPGPSRRNVMTDAVFKPMLITTAEERLEQIDPAELAHRLRP